MVNPCQIPSPLQPGDRLCVISPSGTLRKHESLNQGVEIWRQRGYVVDYMSGYDGRWGYLAGSDAQRRQQLQTAWQDDTCQGILCTRGGYGGTRLLEEWQWSAQTSHPTPKWLIGFSDITSLLWSLGRVGISGVHGPVLTTLAAEPDWSVQRLFAWVEGRQDEVPALNGDGWVKGTTSGPLFPANLTVATHLLGTQHQPDLDGVILAIEDVGEAPYRIDRFLTQWRMMGLLQRVKGIALGRFSDCQAPGSIPSLTLEDVLRDRLCDLGIPIVANLPFGHSGANAALPVGVPVELNGTTGTLTITSNS